jgi:hypothetical protein
MSDTQPTGKFYYSAAQHLCLSLRHDHRELIGGEVVMTGGKIAQFTPSGAGFGSFFTADPEMIRLLDERVEKVGDVFGPDEYQRRIIPAERRAEMLERDLVQANALIAKLQAAGKLKAQAQPQ